MSRTARGLAAACAVAALAGSVTAASAAPVSRATPVAAKATPVHTSTAVALEVFPTGEGPGDEEVCSSFESNIAHQQGVLVDDIRAGDVLGALGQLEAVSNLIDMAGDAGCAVIY